MSLSLSELLPGLTRSASCSAGTLLAAAGVCTAAAGCCCCGGGSGDGDAAAAPARTGGPMPDPQCSEQQLEAAQEPEPALLRDVTAVRTFNPWVEACVARGSVTANPPTRVQTLQNDLAALPLWFEPRSRASGAVLLRQGTAPGAAFMAGLAALHIGVPAPVFVSYAKGRSQISLDGERSALPLLPWGWSPHTQELYSRLRTDRNVWYTGDDAQRQLFGKAWAADLLKRVLARHLEETDPTKRCSCLPITEMEASYQCGEVCRTIEEVCDAIEEFCRARDSKCGIVIKDSFEGSGRGFVHVKPWALRSAAAAAAGGSNGGIHSGGSSGGSTSHGRNRESTLLRPEQLGAVRKILKRCPVVVERWLPMATEFSAHYMVSDTDTGETTVGFRGCLRFSASGLGKWVGSHARDPCSNMEPRVRAALFADQEHSCDAGTPLPKLRPEIRGAFERVRLELKAALRGSGYCGPLSVDAILYETEDAEDSERRLMLKPISEINLRENMGTLVLHLAQYVHPSKAGFYTILSASYLMQLAVDAGEAPATATENFSLARHATKLREDYPLQFTQPSAAGEHSQITNGVLCLTPPGVEFMAVLVVADSTEQAREMVKV